MEIAVKQCRSSGIDCKIHGLSVIGRLKSDEDDVAANFTFLASDNEEDEERVGAQSSNKRMKLSSLKDIQTHVFVWGLNDKDQLGAPKGSKVGCINQLSSVALPSPAWLRLAQLQYWSF